MEDEDIATNMYIQLDPVGMGRKSCLYTILEYCVLARLSAHTVYPLDQLHAFGAISSSSILCPILHTTYHSMILPENLLF